MLLATDSLQTIRKTLAHFQAQSAHASIQIVLAAPAAADIAVGGPDFEGFADVRVVRVDGLPVRRGHAAALRAATAPVVVFAESHAYPQAGFVEKLIEAHRGPWAAVGPGIDNANPDTMLSWAELFMNYGPWIGSLQPGTVKDVPGHNSSYKRNVLLELGERLDELIEHNTVLHAELRSRGYDLYLEPGARIDHLNISSWRWYFIQVFQAARLFAAVRARQWSRRRRMLYFATSPLIPAVRLRRVLQELRRTRRARELLPQLLPALVLGLVMSSIGEAIGYAAGAGRTKILDETELHRTRYVRRSERLHEEDESSWPGGDGTRPRSVASSLR